MEGWLIVTGHSLLKQYDYDGQATVGGREGGRREGPWTLAELEGRRKEGVRLQQAHQLLFSSSSSAFSHFSFSCPPLYLINKFRYNYVHTSIYLHVRSGREGGRKCALTSCPVSL